MTWEIVTFWSVILVVNSAFWMFYLHHLHIERRRKDIKEMTAMPVTEILERVTELEAKVRDNGMTNVTLCKYVDELRDSMSTVKGVLSIKQLGK